ncbi:hypothetical protein [Alkalibacillus haloalkaliphilus]|uniref:hypothetical protein n=1 Tax=Alkalibacillus haloalkaliphilus TaxID=94136 RepID=UPI002936A750|nr:hypothetical protein [Alkalibacillus haloalkaliphilus]MDV2583451.1 hypothetical protein [Alkalibacillus haloalkaliphilus]
MKKRIFLLSGIFLLTACTGEEVKPPTNELEKEVENEYIEDTENGLVLEEPPAFRISVNDRGYAPSLDNYCWEPEVQPCDLESSDPRELTEGYQTPIVNAGQRIQHIITPNVDDFDTFDEAAPKPSSIVLTRYRLGDKQEEFAIEDSPTFEAPEEPGVHHYIAYLTWDNQYYGEATYAFRISVRE